MPWYLFDFILKKINFDLSEFQPGKIYRKEFMPSDFCGTIEYMAPEVINFLASFQKTIFKSF